MAQKTPEKIQQLIKTIYDDCSNEDVAVRENQLRIARRLKLLWEGFQNIWYSEVAHDWRVWDEFSNISTADGEQEFYDKKLNVFKAYLESIIAALSVTVPPIKCFPDDADNTLDLATAKAGDKIAQLIYRHNNIPLLWLHGLFIWVTEGLVACYAYPVEDEKYGTYKIKQTEDVPVTYQNTTCPNCGHLIDQQEMNGTETLLKQQKDKFQPDDDDAPIDYMIGEGTDICPACLQMVAPQISQESFIVTRLIGITNEPKSRICLEAYGLLNVKVPNYARCQKEVPYLKYSYEKDYSLVIEEYPDLYGDKSVRQKPDTSSPGGYGLYEQWARLAPQYRGEYPQNVVTVNHIWIRPGKYNILSSEEDIKELKKKYPDGIKATFINDTFACACNESLDDCWTLLENPLSDYLHFDPAGNALVSVQEITADLISLVLQTIEHGIGQTFVDPAVVNFTSYQQTETMPGGIYPATPKSGKSLNDSFFQVKTATLGQEVLPFSNQIQSMGQLVSGALPSLFGGAIEGSETASQYSMSRAQALQRLQNSWKMFTMWWKDIFGKAIPTFIELVKDDERDVQRDVNGNFVNILIRKADLEGKIGKVELDANENLPMTWGQVKDTVEKLLLNPNPQMQAILSAPENLPIIHDALGLVDMIVPGEDDVAKQNDEIRELLASAPIPDGMGGGQPSVPIDPDYDNHSIQFEICRKWIISEEGRFTKTDNPDGYMNVLLHGKAHLMMVQQNLMNQQQMGNGGNGAQPPTKKPNTPQVKEAPITGDSDVQNATIQ